jgi:hypothetical protein
VIDLPAIEPGDRCPRCDNRRVLDVDRDAWTWTCCPSSAPRALATLTNNVKEHDAGASCDRVDEEFVARFNAWRPA